MAFYLYVNGMLNYFVQSVKITNSNLLLVTILALTNIDISSVAPMYVFAITAVLHFTLSIITYGKIVCLLTRQVPVNYIILFKRNWLNYLIVTIVLGLPLSIFGFLPLYGLNVWIVKIGIAALIGAMTIYVYPILFLKCEGIVSIIAGVYFVVRNLKFSSPLIVATIAFYFTSSLLTLELFKLFSTSLSYLLLVITPMSFIVVYIDIMIFGTATLVLMSETDLNYKDERVIA